MFSFQLHTKYQVTDAREAKQHDQGQIFSQCRMDIKLSIVYIHHTVSFRFPKITPKVRQIKNNIKQ